MPTEDPNIPIVGTAVTPPEGWAAKEHTAQWLPALLRLLERRISALESKDAESREWLEAVMHGTQTPHEPPKPEAQWNVGPGRIALCRYITDTHALQSLLSDLDLLPEQCKPGTREAFLMIMIAQAWKINAGASNPAPIWHDAKTDPPKSSGRYLVYCPGIINPIAVVEFNVCCNVCWWMGKDSADLFVTHWTELPPPP